MSVKNAPVIVIKKKKSHHAEGSHGAWKVAYADFVTAMMAFFLVMWLVGQSNPVKKAVGGYFRDPGVFDSHGGQGILPGGSGVETKPGAAKPTPADVRSAMEAAVREMQLRLAQTPAYESFRNQVQFTVTQEGLRIDLVDADKSSFFDSGSAELRSDAVAILGVFAPELAKLGHDVVIEGHTDSSRYANSDGYTNWELSADRANAARRALERQGFPPALVSSVRGHADRLLRLPDNPLDARNRRVSIVVRNVTELPTL